MPPKSSTLLEFARRFIAFGAALLVWALGVLAYSEELHGALHDHAAESGHTCAITLFNHGAENPAGDNEPRVAAPLEFAETRFSLTAQVAVAVAPYRLPPGCGPPRA